MEKVGNMTKKQGKAGKFRRASMTTRLYGLLTSKDKNLSVWCMGMLYFDVDVGLDLVKKLVSEKLVQDMPRFRSTYSATKKGYTEIGLDEIDWSYHLQHVTEVVSVEDVTKDYMGDLYKHFQFDINKPLWQFTYFSNLADGRSMLLSNINHCMGDGVAQIEILFKLMDKDVPENIESIEQKHETLGITEEGNEEVKESSPAVKAEEKTPVYENKKAVRKIKNAYGPLNKANIFVQGVIGALTSAFGSVDSAGPLRKKFRSLPSPIRSIAFTDPISLAKIKEMKVKYENATVNDILVSLLTMTLTKYMSNVEGGEPFVKGKKKFRASFPINIRSPTESAFDKDNNPHNRVAMGIIKFPLKFSERTQLVYTVKKKLDRIKLSPLPFVQKSVGDVLIRIMTKSGATNFFFEFLSQTSGMLSNVMGPQKPATIMGYKVVDLQFGLYLPASLYMGLMSYDGKVSCSVCMDSDLGKAEDLAKHWMEEFELLYQETMKYPGMVPKKESAFSFLNKV